MQNSSPPRVSTIQFPFRNPLFSIPKFSVSQSRTQLLVTPNACTNNGDSTSSRSVPLPYNVKSITSTANPFVKHCLKLCHSSSYRHSHGSVLLVGTTPIREIYRSQELMQERPTTIDCLLLHDEAEIPEELDDQPIHVVRVSSVVMKKLSGVKSTESIEAIALMRIPSTFRTLEDSHHGKDCRRWFPSSYRILVLDGIQDPGNLGTLLRSAMAFGWDGVFLLPGCCDPFNDKAIRASRGASFQLPIVCGSWAHLEAFSMENQMKILAGHPNSNEELKPVSQLSCELADSMTGTKLCLVLGAEGSGLSEKARQMCELVTISMAGEFESLNVSVAGGIFLYMLQLRNHRFA